MRLTPACSARMPAAPDRRSALPGQSQRPFCAVVTHRERHRHGRYPPLCAVGLSQVPSVPYTTSFENSIIDTSRNHPGDLQPLDRGRSNRDDLRSATRTPLVAVATGWSHIHVGKPLSLVPCRWRMTCQRPGPWRPGRLYLAHMHTRALLVVMTAHLSDHHVEDVDRSGEHDDHENR
jgi:hypothetical protein